MNKTLKSVLIYAAVLIVLLIVAVSMLNRSTTETLPYDELIGYFENDEVESFELDLGTGKLTYKLRDEKTYHVYEVPDVSLFYSDVKEYVDDAIHSDDEDKLRFNYVPPTETPWWLSMLPTLLLIGVMVVFWIYMMRNAGGGGKVMNFGKAKVKPATDKKTTFKDVAGADEEKAELEEIVQFLKKPEAFNALGAKVPKGVLLLGPPGTGKTLLARAVAGEAGVPFFSISGSDFVEMFVGVGASRVRDLFETAKKDAPAIIFIDEIDAVGRHRGSGLGGGHDEREQTLNQLLVEMDGFGENSGVIVMAATNRRDILDPALLRPGRFDRQVLVGLPDIKGREEILKVHARNKPLGPDVDLKVVAQGTVGFTGADLENLLNEAALLAARKKLLAITMTELEEATIKVVAGPEKKSRVVTEKDKRLTALHEAGHAVATYYCETADPVHEISIVPRGSAGGYTMSLPEQDRSYVTKREFFEKIVTLLGGRVSESLTLDDISTGASNDIERATTIARNMVVRYGFSEKLGPIVYGSDSDEIFIGKDFGHTRNYSEEVASEIDCEIRSIFDKAQAECTRILTEHLDKVHEVADRLMEQEKLTDKEFLAIMQGTPASGNPEETEAPEASLPSENE